MNSLQILAGCIVAISLVSPAGAFSVPAVDIDPRTDVADPPGPGQFLGGIWGNRDGIQGWSFTVLEPVVVTQFGWYDDNGDGLSHPHQMGIFHEITPGAYNLLVEETIPQGQVSSLDGPWRIVHTTSTTLAPGDYFVSGLDYRESLDVVKYAVNVDGVGLPVDSRISDLTFPGFRIDEDFGPPETFLLVPGLLLGPMFFIEPVPEPSASALLVIGAVLVMPMARSRMKCQA